MLREEIVFGPIYSRRLGQSLGINLLPTKGKLCNFDCVYCECGWNADGRGDSDIATNAELSVALRAKLQECLATGTPIDSITFSGDGEPTLNPEFAEIIDTTLALRDEFYPGALVSVLTNATMIGRVEVREALKRVDKAILKLDATTDEMASKINGPQGAYHIGQQISRMRLFEGDFVLQTMMLKGPDFDSADMVEDWMNIVRDLRPREVMVYTISRPVPAEGLSKYTEAEMRAMVQPLIDEGFNINIYE